MKKLYAVSAIILSLFIMSGLFNAQTRKFAYVQGQNIILNKNNFFIKGINLGNWLTPEGYMLLLGETSSYRLINETLSELVGPDATYLFWQKYRENYISEEDIKYIRKTGMNTIRIPFHYKMFTEDEYMASRGSANSFRMLDKIVGWCKDQGLYVILDMHAAPGGQTGDNIDDSFGYPWLFVNKRDQDLFVKIWVDIAKHYHNNTTILGYDLLNEPIAHYFKDDLPILNSRLEPLYIRAVKEIRKVDGNHIVILGGAQWNSNFSIFQNWSFDRNLLYTCHRYWSQPDQSGIKDFLDFRSETNLPLFMGETGENTNVWVSEFRKTLESNNIGWTFWPYKKMQSGSSMLSIKKPKNWDMIMNYAMEDRSTFAKIRNVRPPKDSVMQALNQLLQNLKFKNTIVNKEYTQALGMKP